MENIEMVSGYFTKAGYESRLNDEKYLEQVINCMKNAGVLTSGDFRRLILERMVL